MLTKNTRCDNITTMTENNIKTLAMALKQKNRLAGELVRQQQILQRENARRNDSTSKVDRDKVWSNILDISDELGYIKGKITTANIGIYPKLERMAELKSRIAFVQSLPKREGEEITSVGYNQEKLTYTWNSCITQEICDALVVAIQDQINELQDSIDLYNGQTTIK